MELTSLLEHNREAILGRWFELILRTYPAGSFEFLAGQKDRFRNPVGHAITEAIGPIFDQVVSGMDDDRLRAALDGIIRIRSVQDLTPAQAVGFVFDLKVAIREVLHPGGRGPAPELETSSQRIDLASRIDRVALLAFEKYTQCREQLHEVRLNEIRNRSARLMDRGCATSCGSRPDDGPIVDGV